MENMTPLNIWPFSERIFLIFQKTLGEVREGKKHGDLTLEIHKFQDSSLRMASFQREFLDRTELAEFCLAGHRHKPIFKLPLIILSFKSRLK